MTSQRLSNHLRTFRKRSALSQREVAYLLGAQSGAKVCRYERFIREPGLVTALAYEAILREPVSKLFPGLFERIKGKVLARAKRLVEKERQAPVNPRNNRKRQALAAMLGEPDTNHNKP